MGLSHTRLEVADKKPDTGDIIVGELAINMEDALLYTKKTDGTIISVGGSGGAIAAFSGYKNLVINGEVTRINQRGFDGSSFVDGNYCWDRWKASATAMVQIIEDTNYKYSTKYTLSGDGVITETLTSPASGDWTIPEVPRTATNIQLEEGSVATSFEKRPIGLELSLCQRYYEDSKYGGTTGGACNGTFVGNVASSSDDFTGVEFSEPKRVVPTVVVRTSDNLVIGSVGKWNNYATNIPATANVTEYRIVKIVTSAVFDYGITYNYTADAEL